MVAPNARAAPHKYIVVKKFKTLNSQPARNALKQDEFSWIENFMPIGNGFLPAVPGPDDPIASLGSSGSGSDVTTFKLWHFNTDGTSTDTLDTWVVGGSGDPVTIDNADFALGTGSVALSPTAGITDNVTLGSIFDGSWTYDFFAKIPTGSTLRTLFTPAGGGNCMDFVAEAGSPGIITWDIDGVTSGIRVVNPTITASTWYHFAAVRDMTAETYSLYFNGERLDQVSSTSQPNGGTGDVIVLVFSGASCKFDEIRFAIGVAYSGATYTVPASEFS